MSDRLFNELKYTVFAALASIIASMLFYFLYDILEFTDIFVHSPPHDTAEMMVFFLTLSCFCVIAAALSSSCCRRSDVLVIAAAPYAVASAVCSVKEYSLLFAAAITVTAVLTVIKICFLFSKRKPSKPAKSQKIRYRIGMLIRFAVKIFIICCAAVMLILIIKSAYGEIVDRYEEYKWWNEHAGMELKFIFDDPDPGSEFEKLYI